jgi:ABC-type sugar transport system ATPase subunit
MQDTILSMDHIDKYIYDAYGVPLRNTTVKILNDVHFDVCSAEVHILIGENGAGKSTLMNIIGGLIPYDNGTFSFQGEMVQFKGPKDSLSQGIGFIHQELNLCLNLDVAENIFLGCEPGNKLFIDKKNMYAKSKELLAELGFTINPHQLTQNLSTAQQQIVEIVKVLSYDCKIIIMDEPTASLTQKEIDKLFGIIRKLRDKGISVIYISHRFEELKEIGDRITVLRDGCCIGTLPMSEFDYDTIIHMMVGRKLGSLYTVTHKPTLDEILRVENLAIAEHTKPISITVHKGEVVGLSGLVGAGRTELAKSIFGARKFYGGSIYYNGKKLIHQKPRKLISDGLVYLSEDRKTEGVVLQMPIGENITLSSLPKLFRKGFINKDYEKDICKKSIERLGIVSQSYTQLCNTLSGGNQQKVVFAKWLLTNPQLLILDEPTRGIDVKTKTDIYKIIDDLASEGVGILFISSELPEIIGMCDRIYVMGGGTILGELTDKLDFKQEKILSYTVG